MAMAELRRRIEAQHELNLRASRTSLLHHLDCVAIDTWPDPRPFGDAADAWQWDLAKAVTPAVEHLAGLRRAHLGPQCFWRTLPRGHNKTSFLAWVLVWLLVFGRRKLLMAYLAGDHDQAALVVEAMRKHVELNGWLAPYVKIGQRYCAGPGGTVRILTSDAPTNYGHNRDLYVCDEITHWPSEKLWEAIWSGQHKRPHGIFVVITNAGVLHTWQHDLIVEARRARRGTFSRRRRACSWHRGFPPSGWSARGACFPAPSPSACSTIIGSTPPRRRASWLEARSRRVKRSAAKCG